MDWEKKYKTLESSLTEMCVEFFQTYYEKEEKDIRAGVRLSTAIEALSLLRIIQKTEMEDTQKILKFYLENVEDLTNDVMVEIALIAIGEGK